MGVQFVSLNQTILSHGSLSLQCKSGPGDLSMRLDHHHVPITGLQSWHDFGMCTLTIRWYKASVGKVVDCLVFSYRCCTGRHVWRTGKPTRGKAALVKNTDTSDFYVQ